MQPNRILVRYGEIALKGKNRTDFAEALRNNIRHRLMRLGLCWPVKRTHDRIYIEMSDPPERPLEEILKALGETAGIASLTPASCFRVSRTGQGLYSSELDAIEKAVIELARERLIPHAGFAVRVNRADKRFPLTSLQLEQRFGAAIIQNSDWSKVRLNKPEQIFYVDIYPEGIYLYAEKLQGIGGLPVGSGGPVLTLLSGGIDSPVAAYLMAKRGCRVDFIHMTATHIQQNGAAANLVSQLARQLSRFTLRSRLYLLPYTHFDMALLGQKSGYDLILLRRFMARTAQTLAREIGALALVTGDSLGQVASQTLENMVTNSMSIDLPILRPLIGYDKLEIIALAKKIGTYETSIQPYKDCCALVSQNPRTKSSHAHLSAIENRLFPNYQELIEATLADALRLEFDCETLIEQGHL